MPQTLEQTLDAFLGTFEYARNLVASSETFRQRVLGGSHGVGSSPSEAEARGHVYREETLDEANEELAGTTAPDPPPAIEPRPCAVVIKGDDNRDREGLAEWMGSGRLAIAIEALVPAAYRERPEDSPATRKQKRARRKQWSEWLFQTIRHELRDNSGKSDGAGHPYLNAMRINALEGPADSEDEESGDYVGWCYEVEWR